MMKIIDNLEGCSRQGTSCKASPLAELFPFRPLPQHDVSAVGYAFIPRILLYNSKYITEESVARKSRLLIWPSNFSPRAEIVLDILINTERVARKYHRRIHHPSVGQKYWRRAPLIRRPNNKVLLFPQFPERHIFVRVLLHNFCRRHFEVFLGNVYASFSQSKHACLRAHSFALGTRCPGQT